jgi:hypothetical protein
VLGTSGEPSVRVAQRIQWEKAVGLTRPGLYRWWKTHIAEKIKRLGRTIDSYKKDGFLTVGCGAAAKGISMLNMAGVKLNVLADNTPTKHYKVTSGMLIMPFDEIANLQESKVLFVVLAWNVGLEIRRNVEQMRNRAEDVFIETR